MAKTCWFRKIHVPMPLYRHPEPYSAVVATSSGHHLGKLHGNCELPKKSPLSAEDKRENRELFGARTHNEHAIGLVKRFCILAERYRNRRCRFGLIAGICNFDLAN